MRPLLIIFLIGAAALLSGCIEHESHPTEVTHWMSSDQDQQPVDHSNDYEHVYSMEQNPDGSVSFSANGFSVSHASHIQYDSYGNIRGYQIP